jgi:uncharacterized membrane protein
MNGEATRPQTKPIAALTYLLGFVTGIFFLYVEPYNQDEFVRFHARQSIGFSAACFALWVVASVFIAILPLALKAVIWFLWTIVALALAIYWLFLMYKAYQGERYRIPELSDIVDQISGEISSP